MTNFNSTPCSHYEAGLAAHLQAVTLTSVCSACGAEWQTSEGAAAAVLLDVAEHLNDAMEFGITDAEFRAVREVGGLPLIYRARVFSTTTWQYIVERDTPDGWQGVYMTEDARHAVTLLYGLKAFPSA